jgi:hypothetical protein
MFSLLNKSKGIVSNIEEVSSLPTVESVEVSTMGIEPELPADPAILDSIFIDETKPTAALNNAEEFNDFNHLDETLEKSKSFVRRFFDAKDFAKSGLNDSEQNPNSENLSRGKELIKDDFIDTLRDEIERLTGVRDQIEEAKIRNDISITHQKICDKQITWINERLDEIKREIGLAENGEGRVRRAIKQYDDGFHRGADDYNRRRAFNPNRPSIR